MTKIELIELVAREAQLSKIDAEKAINTFLRIVSETLKGKGRLALAGFGTFAVSERKARVGRNPQTGKPIKIPATKVTKFKPATQLLVESQAEGSPLPKLTGQGIFFQGQYYDALLQIREILSKGQKSILLIDGYINEDVLKIFTSKNPGVDINILTKNVPPALEVSANAFNKQYGNLSIRTSQAFHDRFLIVDDKDFYHFGASIKHLGNRGFMFSCIEEPKVIDALRTEWTQEWAKAIVVI